MPPLPPGRLRVGVVGAGKVGAVLGAALAAAGHLIVAASAVSDASLARVAALLPDVPVLPVDEVVAASDLVLLTVPDDALDSVVSGLAATAVWRPGQLALHTCGRAGLAPLAPAIDLGVGGMAVHPAMSFTGTAMDLARLRDCCFGVTAPPGLVAAAQALVMEMGGEPVLVDEFEASIERVKAAYDPAETVMSVTTTGGEIGYIAPSVGRTFGPLYDVFGLTPALDVADAGSGDQGDDISVEAIAASNPNWMLVRDRDAAVAADDPGYSPAADILEYSEALANVPAVQNSQIVYLPADAYTNESIQTYTEFFNAFADALEASA